MAAFPNLFTSIVLCVNILCVPLVFCACPNDWLTVSTSSTPAQTCYKLFPNVQAQGFDAAASYCRSQGGFLARDTSAMVHAALKPNVIAASNSHSRMSFWFGLTDNSTNTWYWYGGPAVGSYTNFNFFGSQNHGRSRDCGYIAVGNNDFKWLATTNCNSAYGVFCQKDVNAPPMVTTTVRPVSCPNGWYGFPTLHWCIQLFSNPLSWTAARAQCRMSGADLVRVNNSAMNTFVNSLIDENKGIYWIGLNDQKKEGKFFWLDDNSVANYTQWGSGMPNDYGSNENCVVIDGNKNDKWDDQDCSTPNRFICQRVPFAGFPSPAPVVTAPHTNCGYGWEDVTDTDSCIVFNTNVLTWLDAKADCNTRGGDLASVASVQEQYYLSARSVSFAADMFWIGANDIATERGWTWSDNTPFAFLNWDDQQPDNSGGSDCAVMKQKSGKWDDVPCQSRNGYICKKKGRTTLPSLVTTTTEPAHLPADQMWGCPAGWDNFRGSCYKLIQSAAGVSFSDAASACSSPTLQGALVAITDDDENDFVFSLIPPDYAGYTWIGLQDPLENTFTWVDGTPVQYTKWELGEPNNQNNEDCVAMDTVYGEWNDVQCSLLASEFICKRSKSIVPRAQPDTELGCTDGALGYGGQCYSFITTPKNFYDAQKDCRTRAHNLGNLATVDSGHLQAFLAAELFISPGNSYWIGLQQSNTAYRWQSSWPVSFTYWGQNHTGNVRGTCVGMQHTGLWADYPCSQTNMSYICESPRTGFTTATTKVPATNQSPCPKGWTGNGALCYQVFTANLTNQLTWLEARDFCARQATGGYLVTIDSNATQTWLNNLALAANASGNFWIGLNDRDTEAGYIWSDNSPFTFSNWFHGQPNDQQHRQDCVEWVIPQNNWNDDYCYVAKNWICQVPRGSVIATTATAPTAVTSSSCGNSSWVYYNHRCYFVSPSDGPSATWFDARQTCMSMTADLASITSDDENGFITSLISKTPTYFFWIGLNDLDMDTFMWTDRSPVAYVSWARNEPNDNYGAESCVQINSEGTWRDSQCQRPRGYICKKFPGNFQPVPFTFPTPTGGCPANFVSLPALSYCYYVGGTTNSSRKNYDDAQAACEQASHNSKLASIHSAQEQKFILTLVAGLRTPAWIGLNDRQYQNQFYWVDSLAVTYTNWGPGQPDENKNVVLPVRPQRSNNTRTNCVDIEVGRNPGTWHDRSCNTQLAYVCRASKDPALPTTAPNTTGCHQGYQRFRSSCYKFFPDSYVWQNAQTICQNDGGNLVTISSGIEQAFVEIVTGHVNDSLEFWLGLKYDQVSAFNWQDGWPVRYTNWGHGEPNIKGDQNCVTNTLDGQWHVVNCTDKNPFVCEINFGSPPPTRSFSFGMCPARNWFPFNGNCYHLETASPKSWAAANSACALQGGKLASIHSDNEARILTNYLQNVAKDVWIGLFKGQGDGFSWYDGTEVEYLNWAVGEPSDPESYLHQDCVKVRKEDGQWADTDCFDENAYLCKAPQGAATGISGQTSPLAQTTLPNGQTLPSGQTRPNGRRTLPSGQTRPSGRRTLPSGQTRPSGRRTLPSGQTRPFGRGTLPSGQTRPSGRRTRPNGQQAQTGQETNARSSSGLSGGGVAGVVIAVLLLVTLGVVFGVLVYRRREGLHFSMFNRRRVQTVPDVGIDNVSYNTHEGAKLGISDA